MEAITITLVDATFNPNDKTHKCLRIENKDSYTFLTLPELYQICFTKTEYKNLLDKDAIFVKEYNKQPEITYKV